MMIILLLIERGIYYLGAGPETDTESTPQTHRVNRCDQRSRYSPFGFPMFNISRNTLIRLIHLIRLIRFELSVNSETFHTFTEFPQRKAQSPCIPYIPHIPHSTYSRINSETFRSQSQLRDIPYPELSRYTPGFISIL